MGDVTLPLMKGNVYYAAFLALVLLMFLLANGLVEATFATTVTTEPMQSPETMNQTQTTPTREESVKVAVGEDSNFTVQYYTFTPQTVEINAGESVTWYSPAELSELHTVTFVLDQNVMSDIIVPFAVLGGETSFELLPPFNVGKPILTQAPDGREAIVALNKDAFYPSVLDANNQTSYFNETEDDIQYTMDGTEKVINSGIIFPELLPPVGAAMNETTTTDNSTTTTTMMTANVTTAPEDEETPQAMEEEGQQQPPLEEPSFPFPLVSSFTVKFEEPGTYPYFCALHPWMTGEVIVLQGEGENQTTGAEAGNQTGML
jgi:plastocyanin